MRGYKMPASLIGRRVRVSDTNGVYEGYLYGVRAEAEKVREPSIRSVPSYTPGTQKLWLTIGEATVQVPWSVELSILD